MPPRPRGRTAIALRFRALVLLWGLLGLDSIAAVPEDAEAALKVLEAFGPVGRCSVRDRVTEVPVGKRIGEWDHAHNFGAADTYPALKGKSAAILAFATHSSRRVIARVVELLCRIQDAPSKKAIAKLAARFPCEGWLHASVVASGSGSPLDGAPPPHWEPAEGCSSIDPEEELLEPGWQPSASAKEQAGKISRGEALALQATLVRLESFDPAEAREAQMTLELIDSRAGWLALAAVLGNRPVAPALMGRLLTALAKGAGHPRALELFELAQAHPWQWRRWSPDVYGDASDQQALARLVIAARPAERRPEMIAFGESALAAVEDAEAEQKIISGLEEHLKKKDAASLRAFMRDPIRSRASRSVAGGLLLQLGEADGFEIYEDPLSLSSPLAWVLRDQLLELQKLTQGPIRAQLPRVLRRYAGKVQPSGF